MYELVVIGVSAGGMSALRNVFQKLGENFTLPVVVVQHEASYADDFLAHYLNGYTALQVKQADEKEIIKQGRIYLAPPGYHLMIGEDRLFVLTTDARVNYARPAIDVLFETAAEEYGPALIGIILTGASADGSLGLKTIKENGGLAIIQNPLTAEVDIMPRAALKVLKPDHVLGLEDIGLLLNRLAADQSNHR